MLAHIYKLDNRKQTLKEHSENVAILCKRFGNKIGFPNLLYLIGIMHDFGKGTLAFRDYLEWAVEHNGEKKSHQNHAVSGAIYAWERWKEKNLFVAQIIALCIAGHHSGFHDCLDIEGKSEFLTALLKDKNDLNYEEAKQYFLNNIVSEKLLDSMFDLAVGEMQAWKGNGKLTAFSEGCLVRILFSVLIDADRWDTACFEYNEDPLVEKCNPDWDRMIEKLNQRMKKFEDDTSELNRIRQKISDECADKAYSCTGIYSLSVPTGGGKTFTSLRYGLHHAKHNSLERIFYVIPYNTILDQNAEDIRGALGEEIDILEHHSNVVQEDENEYEDYKRLTERWSSDIILTSLVQFLNSLFQGKNSNTRRMKQLVNSVIVFDEIQSLPKHCTKLFEKAVMFLTQYCNSTVLLCTATQPQFKLRTKELIGEVDALYRNLKRVQYIPQHKPVMDTDTAAERLYRLLEEESAVLSIVNTKSVAKNLYEQTCNLLRENDWKIVKLEDGMSDKALEQKANSVSGHEILCIHLSTFMCPAHRKYRLKAIKLWTEKRLPVLCVSTALIEAGINVSFPVVVRSMAGLASIIQAAGRCNRNCERDYGKVYIWDLADEKGTLEKQKTLKDIQNGKKVMSTILQDYEGHPGDLDTPEVINLYFTRESNLYTDKELEFHYERWDYTLTKMLSQNKLCALAAQARKDKWDRMLRLKQSFRTAGQEFKVIDNDAISVLVPYGEGKEIIVKLHSSSKMEDLSLQLRKAQGFSVNLYPHIFKRLIAERAIIQIEDIGIYELKENYYTPDAGVSVESQELTDLIF